MIARLVAAGALAAALGSAPFQCAHPPDPSARREDTAGDALYELAQKFKKENNAAAARETLQYLVEHYPSNRHAPAAKDELGGVGAGAGDGG